jgi:methionine synthase II (cobalamin-independent)
VLPVLHVAHAGLGSFLFALADALRTEYRAIIDAELDLQVDDAFIPFMCRSRTAARARMEDMEGGAAAAGQSANARPDRAFDQHRRASGARGRAAHALCRVRWSRQPNGRTDCGFSQSPLAGRVHRSIMWAKLRTLAEGAAIASKMAWG